VDLILKNGMILGILHEVIRALGVIASRGFWTVTFCRFFCYYYFRSDSE
jgi:hypothetical protein